MVVGGPGAALATSRVAAGLRTLDAMDTGHALSAWASRRLPPAHGGNFGDAYGAPGRRLGHVSEGGRYHPARRSTSVGTGQGFAGFSGEGIARHVHAMLPDLKNAGANLCAWRKTDPGADEIGSARAELRALHAPALLIGVLDADACDSDPAAAHGALSIAPRSSTSSSTSSSAWARSRGAPSSRRTSSAIVAGAPRSTSSAWARSRGVTVGQVVATTDDLQARVDSLDRDWNALRTAVCGSARAVGCTGPVATQLGASWVQSFETSVGDWRAFRDDFRQRWFTWGISDGHTIDRWRDELTRYRDDVQAATGVDPVASPQEAPPSALEQAGAAVADAARNAGTGIGIGAGIALLVFVAAMALRGH